MISFSKNTVSVQSPPLAKKRPAGWISEPSHEDSSKYVRLSEKG